METICHFRSSTTTTHHFRPVIHPILKFNLCQFPCSNQNHNRNIDTIEKENATISKYSSVEYAITVRKRYYL